MPIWSHSQHLKATLTPLCPSDPTLGNSKQHLHLYAHLIPLSATQSNTYTFIHAQHSLVNVRYREVLWHHFAVPILHIHPHGVCIRPEGNTLKSITFKIHSWSITKANTLKMAHTGQTCWRFNKILEIWTSLYLQSICFNESLSCSG